MSTIEGTTEPIMRDKRAYAWATRILQAGMYVSFGMMIGGLIWWLAAGSPGGNAATGQVLALDRVLPELGSGNPLALLNLGLLLLLATPAVTLLGELVAFVSERNRRYAGICALVGVVLLLSITISILGLDKAFQSWVVDVFQGG